MEAELSCGVCREVYSAGPREPVVLPSCGHTFCRMCLMNVAQDNGGIGTHLLCPACRSPHNDPPVDALSPVFALLNLSENYTKSMAGGGGACAAHSSRVLEFWCYECREPLCGHCLLEGHVKEGHIVQAAHTFVEEQRREMQTTGRLLVQELSQKRRTLLREVMDLVGRLAYAAQQSQALSDSGDKVARVLEEAENAKTIEEVLMASTLLESLTAEVKALSTTEATVTRSRTRCNSYCETPRLTSTTVPRQGSINEVDWQEMSLEETNAEDQRQEAVQEAAANSREPASTDALAPPRQEEVEVEAGQGEDGLQGSSGEEEVDGAALEEVVSFQRNGRAWPLRCSVTCGNRLQGRVRWEDSRVHAYSFTRDDHTSHLQLQLPLLETLGRHNQPEVFLEVSVGERRLGRVYVRLWGHLRRAQHFVALCMGTHGPSYRGSRFHGVAKMGAPGETLAGGRYLMEDGDTSVRGVMRGLEWGGKHIREKAAGLVVAASGGKPELDSFFHICTRSHPGRKFACAFGEVCAGMDVVHAAVSLQPSHTVTITDCGIVLPPLQV